MVHGMMPMKSEQPVCIKELMRREVKDSTGRKIGKIGDFTFKLDKDLRLSKMILSGHRLEELLETLKIKPDSDPILDSSMIEIIDDHVHIKTAVNNLKTTLDNQAIPEDEFRYSALEKMPIIDNSGEKVGHVIDIDFDADGCASMIVGGSFIEEKLEALGLKADVDIIVPGYTIASIKDKICLSVSKDDLETTMEDAVKSEKRVEAKETRDVARQVSKVRLFNQRPF